MVSSPTLQPEPASPPTTSAGQEVLRPADRRPRSSPLNNRAIEERLPPGSTFKLVTAAAALSSGKYNPDTMVPGGACLDLPQTTKDLVNESRGGCGGAKITLTRALEVSCNVAFGSIGLKLGARRAARAGREVRLQPDRPVLHRPRRPADPQVASVFPSRRSTRRRPR